MSNGSGTVPMFSPDGTLGDVPYHQMKASVAAGGKPAVTIKSPDGKPGWVPADQLQDAVKAGATIVPLKDQDTQHPGFWHALVGDLAGMLPSFSGPGLGDQPLPGRVAAGEQQRLADNARSAQEDAARKAAGYSLPYRGLAPVAEGIGVNVGGMEQSAQQGDVGGVVGHAAAVPVAMAATEGLARGVPKAVSAGGKATRAARNYFTDAAAQGELARTETLAKSETAAAQSDLQQSLREHATDVAKQEGVTPQNPKSIRDVFEDTADQIFQKSKSTYARIDQATGGRFQRFSDALKRIDRQIHEAADIDLDKEGQLIEQRNTIQDSMDQTFEDAKAQGIDAKTIDSAKADFKRAQALYDIDKQVNFSTKGFRKGLDEGGMHTPELVDQTQLSQRLEKLYKTGRLQQAIGDDAADQLMAKVDKSIVRHQTAKEALAAAQEQAAQATKTAATRRKVAGYAAGVATGGGALGSAYKIGKELSK